MLGRIVLKRGLPCVLCGGGGDGRGSGGIGSDDALEDGVPGVAEGVLAGGGAHAGEEFGVGDDFGDGGGEVVVGGDAAGLAGGGEGGGAEDVGGAAVGCDDGRDAAGEGFEDDVAEGVGVGGEDEEVHVGVGFGELLATEDAGHGDGVEAGAEVFLLGAVADDEPFGVDAEVTELGVDAREESDVLFDG